MAEIVEMPRLSDTMTEGVIAAWHKNVGDSVVSGDLLAEIESDKATMDFEAISEGVLLHIGVEEGKGLNVGGLLAIIGEKGEDITAIVEQYAAKTTATEAVVEKTQSPPTEIKAELQSQTPTPSPQSVAVAEANLVAPAVSSGERVKASPLAKAMAKKQGIDLARVNGTGDHGRIIKRDIENYKAPAVAALRSTVAVGTERFEELRVSQMRKTIARRLSESKFSAPHFYLTMEINMDKAVRARKSLNAVAPTKVSYNDMVIKAVAAALRKHPKVNSSWKEDKIRYNHHIHIGMAVAVDEGLLVPVIRFADTLGLLEIGQQARELAGKARERKLQPAEWAGNTFTVSNLGMFGIDEFTAIINAPDACILAIGGIAQKPIVKDGQIVPGHLMKVTLSCDHRVVDGATGAAFLVTLRELLEDPVRILL